MTAEGFKKKITVLAAWETSNESFRLVDLGAGPNELQVKKDGEWKPESKCYVHGVLTHRITVLEKQNAELVDFAIWMTGCGYDFCQHEHFRKQRAKLLTA